MNTSRDEYNDTLASKTQHKREATQIQELGEQLLALSARDLGRLSLTQSLEEALAEAKRIKSQEATRRHAQYIGKLLRRAEHADIEKGLEALANPVRQQRLELWLTRVSDTLDQRQQQNALIQQLLEWFPDTDRQHLRNLLRNLASKRLPEEAPSKEQKQAWRQARRKLHAYLNELDQRAPLLTGNGGQGLSE